MGRAQPPVRILAFACLEQDAVGLVAIPPKIGREAPPWGVVPLGVFLVDDLAAGIAEGRLKNVENDVGLAPGGGLAGLGEGGGGGWCLTPDLFLVGLAEVGEHLIGGAEEGEIAAFVEQDGFVEEPEKPRARLVDGDENDLVVRHPANDLDDVLGVLRRKPGGGLVHEVDVGDSHHVEPHVEAFALAAAQVFVLGVAGEAAAERGEAEFRELRIHAGVPLAAREVGGADRGGRGHVLAHGEQRVEGVVVGDERDERLQFLSVLVEAEAVEEDAALFRLEVTGQRAQERALPASARAMTQISSPRRAVKDTESSADAPLPNHCDTSRTSSWLMMFRCSSMMRSVKSQRRYWPSPMVMVSSSFSAAPRGWGRRRCSGGRSFDDFDLAGFRLVIAVDAEEQPSGGTLGEENIALPEFVGIVGDEILRLARHEVEAAAKLTGAAA